MRSGGFVEGLDRDQVEEVTAGVLGADQRVQPLPRDVRWLAAPVAPAEKCLQPCL